MPDLKRTCGACRSFKRCEAFGVAKPENTECDWAPSHFAWSDTHVAALTAERDALKSQVATYQSDIDALKDKYNKRDSEAFVVEQQCAEEKQYSGSLSVQRNTLKSQVAELSNRVADLNLALSDLDNLFETDASNQIYFDPRNILPGTLRIIREAGYSRAIDTIVGKKDDAHA